MLGEIREQAATVEIQVHDAGNQQPQLCASRSRTASLEVVAAAATSTTVSWYCEVGPLVCRCAPAARPTEQRGPSASPPEGRAECSEHPNLWVIRSVLYAAKTGCPGGVWTA
jgi:hypothetical protein